MSVISRILAELFSLRDNSANPNISRIFFQPSVFLDCRLRVYTETTEADAVSRDHIYSAETSRTTGVAYQSTQATTDLAIDLIQSSLIAPPVGVAPLYGRSTSYNQHQISRLYATAVGDFGHEIGVWSCRRKNRERIPLERYPARTKADFDLIPVTHVPENRRRKRIPENRFSAPISGICVIGIMRPVTVRVSF